MAQTQTDDATFELHGKTLGYPTRFRDGSSTMGLFPVRSRAANQLIGGSGFRVAEVVPGRALLAVICVEYTDTDCGAYNEIALSLFIRKPGARVIPYFGTLSAFMRGDVSSFAYRLPVTTELSRDCGIEMWGFPKTLADIEFAHVEDRVEVTWADDAGEVLRFGASATGGRTPATVSPPVYSIHNGVAHVSHLTQSYTGVGYHRGGGDLRLGRHPIADELRQLGIRRRPLMTVWNSHLDFTMSAPQKVA